LRVIKSNINNLQKYILDKIAYFVDLNSYDFNDLPSSIDEISIRRKIVLQSPKTGHPYNNFVLNLRSCAIYPLHAILITPRDLSIISLHNFVSVRDSLKNISFLHQVKGSTSQIS